MAHFPCREFPYKKNSLCASPVLEVASLFAIGNFPMQNFPIGKFLIGGSGTTSKTVLAHREIPYRGKWRQSLTEYVFVLLARRRRKMFWDPPPHAQAHLGKTNTGIMLPILVRISFIGGGGSAPRTTTSMDFSPTTFRNCVFWILKKTLNLMASPPKKMFLLAMKQDNLT